jgi:cation/acetate symporter
VIYTPSPLAVGLFLTFVGITLALSFWLGAKTKSAAGYFAAGGQIPWFVNGIAFAGDYLSAASFLGICGMIAFYGYDGFLYSIGYLAGWIVALFVVAEPLKRLGKYTFADALDSKFQSRGIKLTVAISTLVVSVFYLIPQMVGAGALVKPLLGFPHWAGVLMVGGVVTTIVVTAGMVSTTYVQFLKGGLLVFFSAVLTFLVLQRGLTEHPRVDPVTEYKESETESGKIWSRAAELPTTGPWKGKPYIRKQRDDNKAIRVWRVAADRSLLEGLLVTVTPEGKKLINGLPQAARANNTVNPLSEEGKAIWGVERLDQKDTELFPVGEVLRLPYGKTGGATGPVGPIEFLRTIQNSEILLWRNEVIIEEDGSKSTVYYPVPTKGEEILTPGNLPAFAGLRGDAVIPKVNFLSLMLALFCGTASLPHILIRYYTVKDQAAARKSTVVGIASIGCFYVLTLYLGLGAMTSGSLDVTDSNMAAPLLARSLSEWLFAVISAIAFTTVLGTVSGLIIACSGAVVHDLLGSYFRVEMNDYSKVRIGKITAVVVGAVACVLGILFEKMNVSYLVGWAFSIAASANLPSLVMLLFWKRTTRQGIIAAVTVGMVSSLSWILLSGDTFKGVYGLKESDALVPFSQPGIVTIPLGFLVLIVVSLLTPPHSTAAEPAVK